MIIIIVVSGIIVFSVIITVKCFNEEDTDKKRVVMWQLSNDKNVGELKEVTCKVTGKDVANILDSIFFYGSYFVMILATLAYTLYVFL